MLIINIVQHFTSKQFDNQLDLLKNAKAAGWSCALAFRRWHIQNETQIKNPISAILITIGIGELANSIFSFAISGNLEQFSQV